MLVYSSLGNALVETLGLAFRDGWRPLLAFLPAKLALMTGPALLLAVWLSLGLLNKGRCDEGLRFPTWVKHPVVVLAHLVRTNYPRRPPEQLLPAMAIAAAGAMFPFTKMLLGAAAVHTAVLDAAGSAAVIFAALSTATVYM